jgi:hypothetical protein
MERVKRRHLIKLAALTLASSLLTTIGPKRTFAHSFFKDIFGDDRLAARLGRLHLRQDPSAGERGRSLTVELDDPQAPSKQERLLERSRADFEKLDIVTVDGWVMARSEADLCAAVHLDRKLR